MSLPLRFTFSSPNKSPESVKSPEFVTIPELKELPDSWSQRYSTPICFVLTTVAGFMAGYTVGRYRK
jgi:hypothetical protein